MPSTPKSTQWLIRGAMLLAASLALVGACVSNDHPRPTCAELADAGTAFSFPDAPYDASPSTDAQPPTAFGIAADPGPACTHCDLDSEFEVMTMSDFEDGFAPAWFNYGEPGIPIEPGQVANMDGGSVLTPDGSVPITISVPDPYWGLQATDLTTIPGGARCGSKFALHFTGGPFVSWGGGYATLYAKVRGATNVTEQCVDIPEDRQPRGALPDAGTDTCGFWMTPVEESQGARLGIDASEFDGISFWARRGPGGQATLRISVLDDNTSTGLALDIERRAYFAHAIDPSSMPEEPACKRIVDCCRYCNDVTYEAMDSRTEVIPGQANPKYLYLTGEVTEKRCHLEDEPVPQYPQVAADGKVEQIFIGPLDGGADSGTLSAGDNIAPAYDGWRRDYKLCCPETMEANPKDGDPLYGGKQCTPYIFNYDYTSGFYCWNPGDPALPERNENRCEDGFEANVVVDTEWRFFRIPWGELRRFTPNYPTVDPRGIWKVAFYFGSGNLDTYVDDIGFYRKRP